MLKFSYPVRMTLKSKSNLAGSGNGSSTPEHILFQQTDIKLKKESILPKKFSAGTHPTYHHEETSRF
jgi:hypothetical protein